MDQKRRVFIKGSLAALAGIGLFTFVNHTSKGFDKLSQAILKTKKVSLDSKEHFQNVKIFRKNPGQIAGLIMNDFMTDKILNIQGWQLSLIECHLILYLQFNR